MVVIRTFRHLCIKNNTNVDSFIIIHASVMSKLTLISDNPLVLLASFTGQRFWVRTAHNYQELGDTASWVLRRLRGQQEASRGEMVTSAWSRYSTSHCPAPALHQEEEAE